MENHRTPSPDASSADAAVFPATFAGAAVPQDESARPEPPTRVGWLEGHMPELVEPLTPANLDNPHTDTKRLRHDGWTPEKKRRFLERFAECGVVVEACQAAGMSARAAYNLRDRDALFAAGWDAASVKARAPLADEAYSRARNGVIERIYKDGLIVAERHRYDNRLTMAVLARLDARIDRAEEKGAPHMAAVANWESYLDAVGEDRTEDASAILAPPAPEPAPAPAADPAANAGNREVREVHLAEDDSFDGDPGDGEAGEPEDTHIVWQSGGEWWTDYPPPDGFDGEEEGEYHDHDYRRTLTPEEAAVMEAEEAGEAGELAEAEAEAAALRDAFFGFGAPGSPEHEEAEPEEPAAQGRSGEAPAPRDDSASP